MQEARSMPRKAHQARRKSVEKETHQGQLGWLAALVVTLVSLVVLIPLILICLAVVLFEVNQWNLPHVMVYDQPVSWMSPDETASLVDRLWNQERQVYLSLTGQPEDGYWLTPEDLGYWVDSSATADLAAGVGRGPQPFTDVAAALNGDKHVVLPVIYFNEANASQTLEAIAKEVDQAPQNASVILMDGQWQALPGKDGLRVAMQATLEGLFTNAFSNLVSGSALLVLEPVPSDIRDLSSILDEVEAVLAADLQLQAYDPILDERLSWSVPADVKQAWVTVDPESLTVSLEVPQSEIEKLVQTWEAELGGDRSLADLPGSEQMCQAWQNGEVIRATIVHEPTTYQVGTGESLWYISLKLGMPMWHIMDANPGLTASSLSAGMTLIIPSKNILLPLPVVENKRILIDISEQRMAVYENGELRNTYIVSTGVPDSPTMAGIFQVQTHEINAYASNWDLYMPHFMGIYEAWPGFMNGIHGLPLLSNGQRLWASALGTPASYGCIILDLAAAEDLYQWADPGVVVEITP